MKISAAIITFNEEENIAAAINSVSWADEIIVIDSHSTDETVRIAEELGARIIVRDWPGFSAQKQFAVDAASNDWILSLDADERVSRELREEILALRESASPKDGYRVPRLSYYMGRPIRHCGWYPDHQLRLFDRRKGNWNQRHIHESFQMKDGTAVGVLKGEIIHYSVENAAHHHKMIGERYAPLAALQMYESGRRTSPVSIFFAGISAFVRSYILRLGFLDGLPGFVISRFAAHHAFLKHTMLWEMQKSGDSPSLPADRP